MGNGGKIGTLTVVIVNRSVVVEVFVDEVAETCTFDLGVLLKIILALVDTDGLIYKGRSHGVTGKIHIFVAFAPRGFIHVDDLVLSPHKVALNMVHQVANAVIMV